MSVVGGHVDVLHEMDSNLNISPKMSCGVLECDIMSHNYMLIFCNKRFLCNKKGHYLSQTLYCT